MSPLAASLALLLVLLCVHAGLLIVMIVRAALPSRRSPERLVGILAGLAALVGELLALRSLVGRPAPLALVVGALGLALLLGLVSRPSWRAHAAGRAAFYATWAAPLVAAFVLAMALR